MTDTTPNLDAVSMFVTDTRGESKRRPLIGLSAGTVTLEQGAWVGAEATVLNRAYSDAIESAGGRPVILTPGQQWSAEEIADLDGLVLTGGTDLNPELYGASTEPTDFPASDERDAFEIALFRRAVGAQVPVLGICRGLQIIAVAQGGDLVQHVPAEETFVDYPATHAALTEVDVTITADSDLALALGTGATVRAYHHQSVRNPGEGLRSIAWHESGLVHAVQAADPALGFVLALQSHPEVTPGSENLFARFVQRSREQAELSTTSRTKPSSSRVGTSVEGSAAARA